ncbi:caspase, EACC1-associated type [Actinoplanes sp. URMC 104]|uniref:caspase family protein n=1 Tax=Actinoplanes sp. URMC 104 TaxID=3423409 RepID=UPI003F1A571C
MSDQRLALVVAVDRYEHPTLHQLAAPAADADALADVLGDANLGGFDVEVMHNPTSWQLGERVERTLGRRSPSDVVLLHFSGHGLKDDAGELYLAATNTQPDLLGSTGVDAAWVNRVMQRSRARSVVLLLDCCYGGAFERGMIRRSGDDIDVGDQFRQGRLDEGRGRVVITASTAMEYAFEGADLAEGAAAKPSVFTGALVEGIRSGEADRDEDGVVSLGELYDFVYDRVRSRSPRQTPSKWEFGMRGDLMVARNPHRRIRAAVLPPELLELVQHPLPAVRMTAVRELAPIAGGENLERAAAAFPVLEELVDDDSRMVSAGATTVLDRTRVRLARESIDLGAVQVGSEPVEFDVAVGGSPLAGSSAVRGGKQLRASLTDATLHVVWTPRVAGELAETITLDGPAGTAVLQVTGRAVAPALGSPPTSAAGALPPAPSSAVPQQRREAAPPAVSARPPTDRPISKEHARVLISAVVVLVLVGVGIAIALARSGRGDDGARAGTGNSGLLSLLPSSVAATCSASSGDGAKAAVSCSPGVYSAALFQLWDTRSDMDDYLAAAAGVTGSCATAPTGDRTVASSFKEPGVSAQIVCTKDSVKWGVGESLLSATFVTRGSGDYPSLYSTAINVLRKLP